jgi:hypothetical protein
VKRLRRFSYLTLAVLALTQLGCDETVPTAPNQVNINITQTQTVGTLLPNSPVASPSPGPGAADKTIVGLKVTEIGGDGAKTFPVGDTAAITATPVNSQNQDPCVGFPTLAACGAYSELDIKWFAGSGVVTDCSSSTGTVCDLGVDPATNYNRRFRTLRAGAFTYTAQFRDLEPVAFTGNVLTSGASEADLVLEDFGSVTTSAYRAGGSGGGFLTSGTP